MKDTNIYFQNTMMVQNFNQQAQNTRQALFNNEDDDNGDEEEINMYINQG